MSWLTPKQHAFCFAYIETGNASDAYRRSYNSARMKPESVHRTAKELLDNPKIASRLTELRAVHVERHNLSIDEISQMLADDRTFARTRGSPSAAVSATMGLAKLHGLLTDKVEHAGQVSPGPTLTDDEVKNLLIEHLTHALARLPVST